MTRYKKELKIFKALDKAQKQLKTNRVLSAFAWIDFIISCKKAEAQKPNKLRGAKC